MLLHLDTGTQLFIIAVVAMISLLLGVILNAILEGDGFGPVGNAIVAGAGFMLGIYVANRYGIRVTDLPATTGIGLAGGFACVAVLALLKAGLNRR